MQEYPPPFFNSIVGLQTLFLENQKDVTERLAGHIPYSGTLSRRECSGAERLRMDGAQYGIWTGDYLWDNLVFDLVLGKKKESDDYSSDSFKKWRLPTLSLRLFLLLALHSQASLPLLSLRASDPLGIAVQILLPFAPMVQLQKPHIVSSARVSAAISKW